MISLEPAPEIERNKLPRTNDLLRGTRMRKGTPDAARNDRLERISIRTIPPVPITDLRSDLLLRDPRLHHSQHFLEHLIRDRDRALNTFNFGIIFDCCNAFDQP